MLVSVYKSSKKQDTYLYITKRDDFSAVPKPLMEMFGIPKYVMIFPLQKRQSLPLVDIQKLTDELNEKGFYLQLPPPKENLLKAHLAEQKNKE